MPTLNTQPFVETIMRMIDERLKFTIIHTPNENKLSVVSCVNADLIKHKFPDFNIYLSGNQKIVERVFYYKD